jgi:ElaB/YqjD/DUF883 family membrane-anchored ribosome-binding protein
MATNDGISREKLVKDMKAVMAEAEALLRATAGDAGEKVQSVRAQVEKTLESAKSRMEDAEDSIVDKVKASAEATDLYVHDYPWPAIGIAAGIGLIVGWAIGRK